MNRLFEKFVLAYYRRHRPELRPCAKQIEWNIVKETADIAVLPIMQTDILLTMEDRTLIIDTKYYSHTLQKQYDKLSIHSQNLFQMHTYVTECDTEHKGNVDGILLYAKTQEDIVPDDKMQLKDGNIIYFRTLDLNQEFSEISNQLNILLQL